MTLQLSDNKLDYTCRLCLGISSHLNDLKDVFDPDKPYDKKISIYLYLRVADDDDLSRKICWSCSSHLDNFHMYHEKIRETQKHFLDQRWNEFELRPIYTVDIVDDMHETAIDQDEYLKQEAEIVPEEVLEAPNEPVNIFHEEQRRDEEAEVLAEIFVPATATPTVEDVVQPPKKLKKASPKKRANRVESESEYTVVREQENDDDEDYPPLALDKNFPSQIIENGLIIIKGKKLQRLVAKFFSLKCETCGDKCATFTGLMEHYKSEHQQIGSMTCCGFKLKKYRSAVLHMAKHIQPDAFKCNICGYIVTRPRFLEKHKLTHLSAEEKPYACPHCPKRFVWKNAFEVHCAVHKPPEERKYYLCHVCSKQYDTPGGLSTHKRLAHSAEKREKILCHICSKEFSTSAGLYEHMATIHQEQREKNQLQCKECGKWLMNKRCLKTHMLLHNGQDICCDLCDYVTKKRTLLNRHKVTHHSTEKPFTCPKCSKQFKLRRALTVHLQVNHSEVPKSYKCEFCDRNFNSSTNYYTHRKNMHPDELKQLQEKQAYEKRLKRIEVGLETPAITVVEAGQSNDGNTQTFIIQLD